MLTRRGLLATVLGTLGVSFVSPALASQVVKNVSGVVALTETNNSAIGVLVSATTAEALSGIGPLPLRPIAYMFRDVSPTVAIGDLIIKNEYEADAFLRRMAEAIALAAKPSK